MVFLKPTQLAGLGGCLPVGARWPTIPTPATRGSDRDRRVVSHVHLWV